MLGTLAGTRPQVGVVLEVVARAEGLVACARNDRYPQLRVGGEAVEFRGELLVGHRVAGVIDLRPVDGDDEQVPVAFGLAVLAHGISSFLPWPDLHIHCVPGTY